MRPAPTAVVTALREAIANSYVLYLQAHAAHWNVEGPRFVSLHAFFSALYTDVFGAIDRWAEAIREHDDIAPSQIATIAADATMANAAPSTNATALLTVLLQQNMTLMRTIERVGIAAHEVGDQGLENFVQERMGQHLKWRWQIKAQLVKE